MSCNAKNGAYRIVWRNDDGEIDAVAPTFSARNDDEAARLAAVMADGDGVELWRGPHLVARLRPTAHSATYH